MPSILFVCTANQFRSPLCAAFFEKVLTEKGIREKWTVDSAGTWVARRTGAHPAALRVGKRLGVDLSQHRAKEINGLLIKEADLVVVMTESQKEALHCEFAEQKRKIVMLSELSGSDKADIPDPVTSDAGDMEIFVQELARMIETASAEIIQQAGRHHASNIG